MIHELLFAVSNAYFVSVLYLRKPYFRTYATINCMYLPQYRKLWTRTVQYTLRDRCSCYSVELRFSAKITHAQYVQYVLNVSLAPAPVRSAVKPLLTDDSITCSLYTAPAAQIVAFSSQLGHLALPTVGDACILKDSVAGYF